MAIILQDQDFKMALWKFLGVQKEKYGFSNGKLNTENDKKELYGT
jgi:hypothetical protein